MDPYMEKQSLDEFVEREFLEQKAEERMTFSSVFKSMIPSVMVGTVAAFGVQEIASEYTTNPEIITTVGMVANYLSGWAIYIPSHFYNNFERLTDESGKVRWVEYARDVGVVLAADRVGNKVWAGTYFLTNEACLRSGVDPATSGAISASVSGTVYSAFTAYVAPKVDSFIPKVRRYFQYLKGGKN